MLTLGQPARRVAMMPRTHYSTLSRVPYSATRAHYRGSTPYRPTPMVAQPFVPKLTGPSRTTTTSIPVSTVSTSASKPVVCEESDSDYLIDDPGEDVGDLYAKLPPSVKV